jgi:hypothetical protein
MIENLDKIGLWGDVKTLVETYSLSDSMIFAEDFIVDEYGTFTVELKGGLNGNGNWVNYLKGLARTFEGLSVNGIDAWIIKMNNDCLDDVFYCKIGVKRQDKDE